MFPETQVQDHVSVTQIRMYMRCPAQYYFRYVLGLKIPPPGATVLGRAVHKGLEFYFREKLDRPEGPPIGQVLEVYAAAFEAESPEADWRDDDPARAKDDGVALLRLHHEEVARHLVPAAVERRVEIPLAGTVLLGFIDLETRDGLIVDHKTVSRTPPEGKAQEDIQLSAYALAYLCAHQTLPAGVRLDFLVRAKQPKIVTRSAARTMRDVERFAKLASGVAAAIRADVFYPNPDNFMCSPGACGYWEECHATF